MGWIPRLKKGSRHKSKSSTIEKLLEDITTLEINTIIKRGMIAAPMPQSMEEIVQALFKKYKRRLSIIFNKYDINKDDFDFRSAKTVEQFHAKLKALQKFIRIENIKFQEQDYARFLRMLSFCEYIYSKADDSQPDDNIEVKLYDKSLIPNVYKLDMSDYTKYRFIMYVGDQVKIKRMFDLGDESVVMQTRFSLDGDVVTRIEESFANAPREVVLEIHDKQTNITVNYWKSLVGMVKDFINGLIT